MLQNFGTALSREEMKNVNGGREDGVAAGCPLKCSDVACSSVTNNCQCKYSGTPNEYCGEH
ncbi:MAG: hypothetical protein QM541_06815 [Flavobacterium sp.]|nr:hypothetical protein [Flavobacterium sp.]